MNEELPKGWVDAALKDLVGPDGMFTDGDWILSEHLKTGNDVRLIQLADIGTGHFVSKSHKFISRRTAEALRVTFLEKGDVLISRMADPLARACLFPRIDQPAITAVDVAVARCDGTISMAPFLMYLCNSLHVLRQAEEVAVGTTRKRISRKNLEQIRVPLPPLHEQQRIVATLEELLGRVSASQERLEQIPAILKRFRQSVLAAACSGRLTETWREKNPNVEPVKSQFKEERFQIAESDTDLPELPETWTWVALGNYARCFRGKFTPRPRNDPRYFGGTHPFIQIGNLPRQGGFVTSHTQTLNDAGLAVSRKFPKGTVVIAIVGATIGNTGVLVYDMCVTDSLVGIETGTLEGNRFVEFFLRHKKYDIRQASYSSGGQPNIKLEFLNPYPLALPPLAEQHEIVRRVETLFKIADRIETRYQEAKERVDSLTQSILAKAFRGELVPQDPEDEPAEKLLERLAQAASGRNKGHGRGKRGAGKIPEF